jgi:hypothetical protein
MKRSESIKELATALAKAQGEMTFARKDSKNPFYKSVYSDLASVISAIRYPLSNNGLAFMQFPVGNEKDEVGIETMLVHSSGEWVMGDKFFIPVSKDDAQGYGSGLAYAKRYSLQAIIGIPSDDDDGAAASGTTGAPKSLKDKPATPNVTPGEVLNTLREASLKGMDDLKTALRAMPPGDPYDAIWSENKQSLLSAAKKATADATEKEMGKMKEIVAPQPRDVAHKAIDDMADDIPF